MDSKRHKYISVRKVRMALGMPASSIQLYLSLDSAGQDFTCKVNQKPFILLDRHIL